MDRDERLSEPVIRVIKMMKDDDVVYVMSFAFFPHP